MAEAAFLGHVFADAALLEEALRTPSCKIDRPGIADNQRLEFLGDAVLGLLSAERLYAEFPSASEGALTVRRTRMVSSAALCAAADRLGLAAHLRRNRSAAAPLPRDAKTLADAVEAVIGAAYLDGGLAAAAEVFDTLALEPADGADGGNPKGELQERAQSMKPPRHPEYSLVKVEGKAHAPVFTVKAAVEGVGEAVASAGSRKAAETRAAEKLLSMFATGI